MKRESRSEGDDDDDTAAAAAEEGEAKKVTKCQEKDKLGINLRSASVLSPHFGDPEKMLSPNVASLDTAC